MSSLDSGFFHLEDRHTSLHIASLAIFEGPVPPYAEIRSAIARKLPLVPRYRQRARVVPLDLARPVWVDDPRFDLDDHLHRIVLRRPGGPAELQEIVGRLLSKRLDRAKPLWEDWVLEGLEDGRWAMVTKVHHSMVDGIAGTDLLSTVFDHSPQPDAVPVDTWDPGPEPGALRLLAGAAAEGLTIPLRAARSALRVAEHPRRLAGLAVSTGRGLSGYATAILPTSSSSLSGPIGLRRQYRWTQVPMADIKSVRAAFGGTLNDVVLAAITHALRVLLLARGEEPGRHSVRTLVPVSVRPAGDHGHFDNQVSALLADLPVEAADPVAALHEVQARLRALKGSDEAVAGEVVTELADFVPPPALAASLHLAFRFPQRALTTVTTNVPGPRSTLYLAGCRMLATYPYVPIADRLRTGVAVTSYGDRLLFGLTADWDSVPDIDLMLSGLEEGFAELVKAAEDELGKKERT